MGFCSLGKWAQTTKGLLFQAKEFGPSSLIKGDIFKDFELESNVSELDPFCLPFYICSASSFPVHTFGG